MGGALSAGLFAVGQLITLLHLWLAMRAQQRQQDWSWPVVFRGELALRVLGIALTILPGIWLESYIGVGSTLLALTPTLIAASVFEVIGNRRRARATRAR